MHINICTSCFLVSLYYHFLFCFMSCVTFLSLCNPVSYKDIWITLISLQPKNYKLTRSNSKDNILAWRNIYKVLTLTKSSFRTVLYSSTLSGMISNMWERAFVRQHFTVPHPDTGQLVCVLFFSSTPLHIQISLWENVSLTYSAQPEPSCLRAPKQKQSLSIWKLILLTALPLYLVTSFTGPFLRCEIWGETWQHSCIHALVRLDMTHGFLCKIWKRITM